MWKELTVRGHRVGKERIRRLVQQHGIRGRCKRKFVITTDSKHQLPIAPDLLQRNFTRTTPNQVWTGDITYIATDEGGVYLAAILLVTAGDNPTRLRSEAALAALCGTSPLQASSGKTQRHRLNRGGDRQANNALWTIAMVRMRSDVRTRDYVAKRTSQGLSKKEIHRCLKRYIVRELYPLILADLKDSISSA